MNDTLLNTFTQGNTAQHANFRRSLSLITSRNYVVVSVSPSGEFSMSNAPVGHHTLSSALAECSRLSRVKPGTVYTALKIEGARLVPQTVAEFQF
jgi:hypothetical protein